MPRQDYPPPPAYVRRESEYLPGLRPVFTVVMHSRNLFWAWRSFWNEVVRCSSSSSSCFLTAARLSTESVVKSTTVWWWWISVANGGGFKGGALKGGGGGQVRTLLRLWTLFFGSHSGEGLFVHNPLWWGSWERPGKGRNYGDEGGHNPNPTLLYL